MSDSLDDLNNEVTGLTTRF